MFPSMREREEMRGRAGLRERVILIIIEGFAGLGCGESSKQQSLTIQSN